MITMVMTLAAVVSSFDGTKRMMSSFAVRSLRDKHRAHPSRLIDYLNQ
jgi:hypothetical protein